MPATKTITEPAIPAAREGDRLAAAELRWKPAALVAKQIIGYTLGITGAHTLWWGDGTSSPGTGAPQRHSYHAAGDYMFTAKDDSGAVLAQVQVRIRDGLHPNVTFAQSTTEQDMVIATFNDDGAASDYEVTWGPQDVENLLAPKGTQVKHPLQPGTHTIVVRDLQSGRALSAEVEMKPHEFDPDCTITKGADTQTAFLKLTKVGVAGKKVLIDWGYNNKTTTIDGVVDGTASFTYPAGAETYLVEINYDDGSTSGPAYPVTIPFPARDKGTGRP